MIVVGASVYGFALAWVADPVNWRNVAISLTDGVLSEMA